MFNFPFIHFTGGPRSKKGQKKQSIWPTKLSLGFLGNKSKSKRPFSSKKPSLAAKHPAPFSSPSLQVRIRVYSSITCL